ncbi:MAG: pre-peptidase C-terminal domain-containing protein [Sinimarinibacterium flocculans]|uniref:PPC domain-containing protein n=1 Tax=Sinimarinibacterium flocculans TaxID=985250 RepID=UPI003C60AE84
MSLRIASRLLPLGLLTFSSAALAGAYVFAEGNNNPDYVAHPKGYVGTGGNVTVNICIDQNSPNAADMVIPIQNVVRTFNGMQVVNPNLKFGTDNDIGSGQVDFESTALHEVGHCIGLAHPNAATESGLSEPQRNFTKALPGPDGVRDLDDGADNIIGSSDDLRDDDINLHWFRLADNNPFLTLASPSGSTMSVDSGDLPAGSSFAANADRSVGAALGFVNSEAVMQQGAFTDEDQRALVADDVDTLRLARTGLDRTPGTGDDYTVTLTYGGLQPDGTAGCDITIDFDDTETGFAVCQLQGALIDGSNVRITSAKSFYNTSANWYFNPVPNDGVEAPDPFSFTDQFDVPLSSVRTSNTVTISGLTGPVPVNVSGGTYSIGCTGSFTGSAGSVENGDTICVRHTSAATGGTTVNTTLTVGGGVDTFSSTTTYAELQNGVAMSGLSGASGSEQIYRLAVPAGASNLQISISGGSGDADLYVQFGTPPTLGSFDCRPYLVGNSESCDFPAPDEGDWFVMVQGYSAYSGLTLLASFDAPVTDTEPNPFDFTDRTVVGQQSVYSNVITVTGIDAPAPLSLTGFVGARYSINGGPLGSDPTTVSNGDKVRLRIVSAATPGTRTATLDIGGVTDSWSVTSVEADLTPNAFDFRDQAVTSQQTVYSNTIRIQGFNQQIPLSLTGHPSARFSINGGPLQTGTVMIKPNDLVRLRLVSSPNAGDVRTATVDIGGVVDDFNVSTEAVDTAPDAFDFEDVTVGGQQGVFSNTVRITGINTPTTITLTGHASASFSINGGPLQTGTAPIEFNDTVRLRIVSSPTAGSRSASVDIGGVTDSWTVTTQP